MYLVNLNELKNWINIFQLISRTLIITELGKRNLLKGKTGRAGLTITAKETFICVTKIPKSLSCFLNMKNIFKYICILIPLSPGKP